MMPLLTKTTFNFVSHPNWRGVQSGAAAPHSKKLALFVESFAAALGRSLACPPRLRSSDWFGISRTSWILSHF
jgi:hypothetical protein